MSNPQQQSLDFNFQVKAGMVIAINTGDGGGARKIQGIIIQVSDVDLIVWPLNADSANTQISVFPRQGAMFTILRFGTQEEISRSQEALNFVTPANIPLAVRSPYGNGE